MSKEPGNETVSEGASPMGDCDLPGLADFTREQKNPIAVLVQRCLTADR